MAHWYKVSIGGLGVVVCRAKRKAEVLSTFSNHPWAAPMEYVGCVAAEKIPQLKSDPQTLVAQSPEQLGQILSTLNPRGFDPSTRENPCTS